MVTITTTTATTEVKPFPKLMKDKRTDGIFFFTEPKKGLWIRKGIWHDYLAMEYYEDYNEAITIKNK